MLTLIGSLLIFWLIEAGSRWIGLNVQLTQVAKKLGAERTLWTWRMDLESMKVVQVWRDTSMVVASVIIIGMVGFGLWFIWPALRSSTIARWTGVVTIIAYGASVVTLGVFRTTIKSHIEKDL